MLVACGAAASVEAGAVPALEFALRLAEEGVTPGGTKRNLEYVAPATRFGDGVGESLRLLLCDAQTSGGLLIAVPPESEAALIAELEREGTPAAAGIGEIVAGQPGRIEVR